MIKFEKMEEIEIPKSIKVTLDGGLLTISGPKGETRRTFRDNFVRVELSGNKLIFSISKNNNRNRAILGTWSSITKLLFKGVTEGYQYEMKIDYTHFPMRVSVKGDKTDRKSVV